jgi:hypothetical protein
VLAHYAQQYVTWLNRLSGPALEEAVRPVTDNMEMQRQLKIMGFVPPTVVVNGVIDDYTRAGVKQWQISVRHDSTGFLSDNDALLLLGHQ